MKENKKSEGRQITDWIDHPPHYEGRFLECIDFIRYAAEKASGIDAYCMGTVIKYIWRWPMKGGVQDLQKAEWYLLFWRENGHFIFSGKDEDPAVEQALQREMESRFPCRETGESVRRLLKKTAAVRCRKDISELIIEIRKAWEILP